VQGSIEKIDIEEEYSPPYAFDLKNSLVNDWQTSHLAHFTANYRLVDHKFCDEWRFIEGRSLTGTAKF